MASLCMQRLLKRSRVVGEFFRRASVESGSPAAVPSSQRRKFPKLKKSVLLLCFNGRGYLGIQRNRDMRTIEGELFPALIKAGAIPPDREIDTLHYQRCSRTDRGVSAARMAVSLKIRVLAMIRVTRGFHARKDCLERTYEYVMPSYALAPPHSATLSYRIDDNTIAKADRLLQNFIGWHNFHNFSRRREFEDQSSRRHVLSFQVSEKFMAQDKCKTCGAPIEIEFVSLKVSGKSFITHQIRKMIGLVIAVIRGAYPKDSIATAFNREHLDLPRAPGCGLLLESVHFDNYNRRYGSDGSHEPLEWSRYEEQVEQFKRENIYKTIIDTEVNQLSMIYWLCCTLQLHIACNEKRTSQVLLEAADKERDCL